MSELNIRGSVRYGPGSWGLSAPVAGAKLTLRQTSVGSSDPRTIWEGTTDSRGEFAGRTQEWRRTIRIAGHEGTDPTDLLALSMRIEMNGQSVVRPFVYLADFVPSPPLIASWMPPNAVVARINGRDCYTVADVARQCVELMRRPSAVDIEIPEESLLTGASNQEGQLNQLIAWWLTELRDRLREARPVAGTLAQRRVGAVLAATEQRVEAVLIATQQRLGPVQTARQQGIGAVLTATQQRVGAVQQGLRNPQAEIGWRNQADAQLATSVLITTLQVICAVVGVVLVVCTLGTAAPLIIAAVIALVAAVAITGAVAAPAAARAVLQIAWRVGGLSLNLVVDATVVIVSIVLLMVLVFMLAGRHGVEWARITVLGGRRGWKIRLS